MAARTRRSCLRVVLFAFATIGLLYTGCLYLEFSSLLPSGFCRDSDTLVKASTGQHSSGSSLLTETQCRHSFPGLFKEIDDSVARGSFTLKRAPDDYTGLVQGRIADGKLYIISVASDNAQEKIWWRSSILHALHRAIITSPEPLPDTYFSLVINDSPRFDSWSFSRSHSFDAKPPNTWLMPHFSGWSWPLPFIRSMDEAQNEMMRIEDEVSWEDKIDRVIWRGTSWFNGIGIPDLRPKLLKATKEKEWADVEALRWKGGGNVGTADNAIKIEDFCRYKYIAYTEGVTYSGRLPFHQSCASVILTPPITHLQHTSHLIRPLYSFNLPLKTPLSSPNSNRWTPNSAANATWPNHYSPKQANLIFVAPDWSDLEAVIMYLRENPSIAKGIASRQRELYGGRGYFGVSAETCYWRGLIRGWSQVAKMPAEGEEGYWGKGDETQGMRWENYVLLDKTVWE